MVSLNELREKELQSKESQADEDSDEETEDEDDFAKEILDAIAEAERIEAEMEAQESFYETTDFTRLPCVSHKVSVSLPGILGIPCKGIFIDTFVCLEVNQGET